MRTLQPRCRRVNARSMLLGQARRVAVVVSPWARVAPTMLAGTRLGASGSRDGSRPLARGIALCVGSRQRGWDGSASARLKTSKTSRLIAGAQTGPTRLGYAQHAKASTGHGARHVATAGELLGNDRRKQASMTSFDITRLLCNQTKSDWRGMRHYAGTRCAIQGVGLLGASFPCRSSDTERRPWDGRNHPSI